MSDERPTDDRGRDVEFTPARAERWAEIAGDLVLATEVLPGPASIPDLEGLRTRHRNRKWRRRAAVTVASLTAATAMGVVTMRVLSHRQSASPLSYVVEGTSTVQADAIEAPLAAAGGGCDHARAPARDEVAPEPGHPSRTSQTSQNSCTRIRFTEGTAIALAPGARLRIPMRTAVGADLILDRGHASFAVVHRPATRWTVSAGPFTVDVTGTRFSVDWEADAKRLTLDLEDGGVVVRGNAAGPGIAVHPGERLVASMTDGRVTVEPKRKTEVASVLALPTPVPATVPTPTPIPTALTRAPSSTLRPRQSAAASRNLAAASPHRNASRAEELRSDLQPPPVLAPSAPSLVMGGGGVFCAGDRASLGFEESDVAVSVPPVYHLAFSGPRADRTHSWCGVGSARLDVNFNEIGKPNFMGRLPHQSGQLVVRLARLMDFTDKTVSLHVYFDGPTDARVAAQLYVIHHGKWVNGPVVDHLVPRRWWTISHTFRAENPLTVGPPYPPGGTSLVTDCDRIALVVYSTGGPRTWSGAVYVDDVGWK